MSLPRQYQPEITEPRLEELWQQEGIYHFRSHADSPVYVIDTPPPTVSGHLHLGHLYSYSHADFMARYFRMQGRNVFYPMGFDDNGLPTERLVEKRKGVTAQKVGREQFIATCLQVSEEAEKDYRTLWQRLGLSIDWRHTYRTIEDRARKVSQQSFLDLYRMDRIYRSSAPTIWCPECRTAIAQAELSDLDRASEFVTLDFRMEDGSTLPIATTRPELLPACVAIFVHPDDARYQHLLGSSANVPLYGQRVPILSDPGADPEKGTGAVMCCTFGDQADVTWWYVHKLSLVEAIDASGCMTSTAALPGAGGESLVGLPVGVARQSIKKILEDRGLILGHQPTVQSLRVHERCDTPVEYIITRQWFVKVLDHKAEFLAAGEQLHWHPEHMAARYRAWVENLNWDWCISRQRYFGVPFPVWYCKACGAVKLADSADLPVDPLSQAPRGSCTCGGQEFEPDRDVMDTWATSSLSAEIVTGWLSDADLHTQTFPTTLRPQAHEIIRTWLFYSLVKAYYHFGKLPWSDILISGWGLAGEGMGKISKSRGGGPMPPLQMIQRYSADAVRYWASSTSPGRDSIISEEKIQMGAKLATKLWNVARFSETFIINAAGLTGDFPLQSLSPADRWILASLQSVVRRVTASMEDYEYAAAKSEVEAFFWKNLADNYLEMAKQRLYAPDHPGHRAAVFTLCKALETVLKLLAPFLPYVTDAIYRELFVPAAISQPQSIHISRWPSVEERFASERAERFGDLLVEIATAVRRFKSEQNLSLGTELHRLQLAVDDPNLFSQLNAACADLTSITRAKVIELLSQPDSERNGIRLAGDTVNLWIEAEPKDV